MPTHHYFITGATGFLGGEFLRTVLERDPFAQCYCLVRDQGNISAERRLLKDERVCIIRGDITQDNLGLTDEAYKELAQKITHVVHTAAMVQFEKPKAILEKINVTGTKNVLNFAKTCHTLNPTFHVYGHVSTAYVAGKCRGVVTENDLTADHGFKNHYESTKFAAEALVHAVKGTLPVIIFRPSIILGNSQTGVVTRSNVIFPLVQVVKKCQPKFFPCNTDCRLDMVGVDYVAQAMFYLLMDSTAIGHVFHLTCGLGHEMTVGEELRLFKQIYHLKTIIIPPWTWDIVKQFFSLTRQGRYIVQAAGTLSIVYVSEPTVFK